MNTEPNAGASPTSTTALADQWEENNWHVSVLSHALRDPLADELVQRPDLLRVVIPRLRVNGYRPLWIALLRRAFPDAAVVIPEDRRGVIAFMAEAWLAWAYKQTGVS